MSRLILHPGQRTTSRTTANRRMALMNTRIYSACRRSRLRLRHPRICMANLAVRNNWPGTGPCSAISHSSFREAGDDAMCIRSMIGGRSQIVGAARDGLSGGVACFPYGQSLPTCNCTPTQGQVRLGLSLFSFIRSISPRPQVPAARFPGDPHPHISFDKIYHGEKPLVQVHIPHTFKNRIHNRAFYALLHNSAEAEEIWTV